MSLKKRNDPVGWTVRYKMMNYKVIPVGIGGIGSVYGANDWYFVGTGSL